MSVAIVQGVTGDGRVVALRLNNDGTLALQATSADGETLGTGATAANQVTQIDRITEVRDRVGTVNDSISNIFLKLINDASISDVRNELIDIDSKGEYITNTLGGISRQLEISAIPTFPFCTGIFDGSGEISSNSSQLVFPGDFNRRYLFIQNQSETEDLWINFILPATIGQPSIRIPPLASFTLEGTLCFGNDVNIIGAIGTPFTAKQGTANILRSVD